MAESQQEAYYREMREERAAEAQSTRDHNDRVHREVTESNARTAEREAAREQERNDDLERMYRRS